jgi:putative molybdopterin biosynthesis protein
MYLRDIPLAQAKEIFRDALAETGMTGAFASEEIPLDDTALGRVLADPVMAVTCSPAFHSSAMDGFAVKAEETVSALPASPVVLMINKQTQYVDTGDPLPVWANAVIPIENVESLDENGEIVLPEAVRRPAAICIRAGVTPWSYVRMMGEDIVAGQLLLVPGQKLRPADLGMAAAGGVTCFRVAKLPLVGILPTGTELVSIGCDRAHGQLIEFNSVVLAAQVQDWGGQSKRYPITPDDFEQLKSAVAAAANECDLLLINAGSSAGSEDYTSRVVEALGKLLVHGIAVRPGHPVVIGLIACTGAAAASRQWTPVIGVPGYPVSAAMTGEILIQPLLHEWLGLKADTARAEMEATLTRKIVSPAGDDDYVRVVVGDIDGKVLATPLSRGAGVTTSLARADGIVVVPRSVQGVEAGEKVKVNLFRSAEELQSTIFCIGSHDLTLDLLAQFLAPYGRRLVTANVGSLGGLLSLKRNETHFAGSHLLDEETGIYNISSVRKYLPEVPVTLFGWVERVQGLIVPKGNPKKISAIRDLGRKDVTFINRQRGSGTRVLLDYWLKKESFTADEIHGYDQEEFTHLGVAVAVASGRADCGLAIEASAATLDLDFIPLGEESYQLVFPTAYLSSPLLKPVFDLMSSQELKKSIQAMPGYKVTNMGCTIAGIG